MSPKPSLPVTVDAGMALFAKELHVGRVSVVVMVRLQVPVSLTSLASLRALDLSLGDHSPRLLARLVFLLLEDLVDTLPANTEQLPNVRQRLPIQAETTDRFVTSRFSQCAPLSISHLCHKCIV